METHKAVLRLLSLASSQAALCRQLHLCFEVVLEERQTSVKIRNRFLVSDEETAQRSRLLSRLCPLELIFELPEEGERFARPLHFRSGDHLTNDLFFEELHDH